MAYMFVALTFRLCQCDKRSIVSFNSTSNSSFPVNAKNPRQKYKRDENSYVLTLVLTTYVLFNRSRPTIYNQPALEVIMDWIGHKIAHQLSWAKILCKKSVILGQIERAFRVKIEPCQKQTKKSFLISQNKKVKAEPNRGQKILPKKQAGPK